MTIGGNDLFFKDVVSYCFGYKFTEEACHSVLKKAETKLKDGTFRSLFKHVLDVLHEGLCSGDRPGGVVIIPTYPDVVKFGSKKDLWYIDGWKLVEFDAAEETRRLRNLLEAEQKAAVDAANNQYGEFVYLFSESKKVFKGHEPDPDLAAKGTETNWIWDISAVMYAQDERKSDNLPLPEASVSAAHFVYQPPRLTCATHSQIVHFVAVVPPQRTRSFGVGEGTA